MMTDHALAGVRGRERPGQRRREAAAIPIETRQVIPDLVAESESMRAVVALIHQLAPCDATVLVEGETGTGKEVVARAVHDLSERASGPFVVVDCGALPATLIASDLFGHERGSFTGANDRRIGAFERAGGGTVFLDEIGELPLALQPMLLGVLERRRFRRVGGSSDISVDVRVVAATNRDLRGEVKAGGFRSDLFFRLASTRIRIPPLRDRTEEIASLVRHFVRAITGDQDLSAFPDEAMAVLRKHRWSGNVRELRNVVENAIALGRLMLGDETAHAAATATTAIVPYRSARSTALSEFETRYLRDLLAHSKGNVSEAARRAQMDRAHLLHLLRRNRLR